MSAPLAIAHIVMLADAAEREASRAHVAALLRDHHLALPDAATTHLRMDLGAFRLRWELHYRIRFLDLHGACGGGIVR